MMLNHAAIEKIRTTELSAVAPHNNHQADRSQAYKVDQSMVHWQDLYGILWNGTTPTLSDLFRTCSAIVVSPLAGEIYCLFNWKDPGLAVDPVSFFL